MSQLPPDEHPDDLLVAEVDQVANAWARAIVSNDADRIGEFMADEWVIVSETGISPREDFLSAVRSGDLTHSAMERVGPARIRRHGDVAVLTARVTNTAHHRGEQFDADEWTTDVFIRTAGGWRCVLSHITAAKP